MGRGGRVRSGRAAEAASRSTPISKGIPTPRLPFVDVATGSLGQGICAAVGIALNARRIQSDYRTYCLLGDGESAEGSVWEAANVAADRQARQPVRDHRRQRRSARAGRRCGSTTSTQFARRWRAFGWHAIVIDGHDMNAILDAFAEARAHQGPADDDRGADDQGQRGLVRRRARTAGTARRSRKAKSSTAPLPSSSSSSCPCRRTVDLAAQIPKPAVAASVQPPPKPIAPPAYKLGEQVATREAYGTALAKLATPTSASSRSMPTSRTRPSATSSRRRSRIASTRTSSPSRS